MDKTQIELKKFVSFYLPNDPRTSQKDFEYYNILSKQLMRKFQQCLSIFNTDGRRRYRIISMNDENANYFDYDVVFRAYNDDRIKLNYDQIIFDLSAISVIITHIAEINGFKEWY
ncbi:hypothetical protein UES1_173 [Escherichia phage UE-S1]|nr:hypothetical protein UES1_173 [Escherichia phage UE-S1]